MAETDVSLRRVCVAIGLAAIVLALAFLVRTHHLWNDGLGVTGSYAGWSEFVQARFVSGGRDIEPYEFPTANYASGIYRTNDDLSREDFRALFYTVLGIDTAEGRESFNNYGLIFGVFVFPLTMLAVYRSLTRGHPGRWHWLAALFILYLSLFATSSLINFTDAGYHHQVLGWIYLAIIFMSLPRATHDWRYALLHVIFSIAIPFSYRTSAMFYLSISVSLLIVWSATLIHTRLKGRSVNSLDERLDLTAPLVSGVIVLSVFIYLSANFFSMFSGIVASFPEFLTGTIVSSRYDEVRSYLMPLPTWIFRLNLIAWLFSSAPVVALLLTAYVRQRSGKPLLAAQKVGVAYVLGVAIFSLGLWQWAGLSGIYARTTETLSLVVILSFVVVAAVHESRRVVYVAAILAFIGSGLGLISYLTAFDASQSDQLTTAEAVAITSIYDLTSQSESGFYTDLRIGGALVGQGALQVAGPPDSKPREAIHALRSIFYEPSPHAARRIIVRALPVESRYLLLSTRMMNTRVGFQSGDFTYKPLAPTVRDTYAASPLFDLIYDGGVVVAFRAADFASWGIIGDEAPAKREKSHWIGGEEAP